MSRIVAPIIDVATPKVILLDIDGVCGPYSYFESVMKPFLYTHIRPYIGINFDKPVVQDIIKRLRIEYKKKIPVDLSEDHRTEIPELTKSNKGDVLQAVFANFMSQVEEGKKSQSITGLCWLVWTDGFRQKLIKAEVFPDVPEALMRWKNSEIQICTISSIISSGQQLLFSCTNYGNLDTMIDGCLCTKDTEANKNKKECYRKICNRLDIREKDLLFFTDIGREAVAAKDAGCRSILVKRPGNKPLKHVFTTHYNVITSFNEVNFV